MMFERQDLKTTCKQCNNEFFVRSPSEVGKRVNCSSVCASLSQKKDKFEIKCHVCNKSFFRHESTYKIAKYCSRKCKGIEKRKIKDGNLRQCNKCNEVKNLNDFSGRLEYICKICRRKISKSKNRTKKGRYNSGRNTARLRNSLWDLSFEEYCSIIDSNTCHYCLDSLDETGSGLDRKNNNLGYLLDNVVPCCNSCNVTKMDIYSYEEMMQIAEVIRKIKINRKNYSALN